MLLETDTASENMRKDLLFFSSHNEPAFRFYAFKDDCVTVGYSQDMSAELDTQRAAVLGIDIAKRPTGGGIVFHSRYDVVFCCVLPLDLFPKGFMSAYHFVSDIIVSALEQAGIDACKTGVAEEDAGDRLCFSSAKEYEITCDGKKLVGIAQKRTRGKILQQGTICVSRPDDKIFSILRKAADSSRYFRSAAVLDDVAGGDVGKNRFLKGLKKIFSERFETKSLSVV